MGAGCSSSQQFGQLAHEGAVLEAAGRDQALPVLSLLVLLTLCDGSGHRTLALVDITDAHPLPVNRLLPQGHLQASTHILLQVCIPALTSLGSLKRVKISSKNYSSQSCG